MPNSDDDLPSLGSSTDDPEDKPLIPILGLLLMRSASSRVVLI